MLDVLATMPEEAFGYFVLALKNTIQLNEWNHGFTSESTKSFIDLAKAVNEYVGFEFVDMDAIKSHNPTFFEDKV